MNIRPADQTFAEAWPAMARTIARPRRTPRAMSRATPATDVPFLSLWKGLLPPAQPITMAAILADVAKRHRITVEDLKGPVRVRNIAWARQEAMWLMVETQRWSLPQIGRAIGGRDHTTILYGWRRHACRLADQEAA